MDALENSAAIFGWIWVQKHPESENDKREGFLTK